MTRVGFLLKVKEEYIDEYKIHHKNVWSEMKNALSRNGWKNYSLFMRPDGLLFGYFEADKSLADSIKRMESEKVNTDWQELMSPYFEIPEGSAPDQAMIELEEVFHLD